MAFTTKYPNILFFPVSLFFSSTCRHNFGGTVARKSFIGGFIFVRGARHSENLCLIHNTAFANCVNKYKLLNIFPQIGSQFATKHF